jgi:Zn finger protein HypA/HybF involved in hydrogenase expression
MLFLVKAVSMKKFEGTIYAECDLCWKKTTWYYTCYGCGHTVCIMCLLAENFECPVCGGDFIEPIPKAKVTKTKTV